MNNRRLAKSSGSPRLPFICMTVYRTFWRRSDNTRSCSARSRWLCTGCDVRTPITILVRHVFSELEIRFSSVSINWRWAIDLLLFEVVELHSRIRFESANDPGLGVPRQKLFQI